MATGWGRENLRIHAVADRSVPPSPVNLAGCPAVSRDVRAVSSLLSRVLPLSLLTLCLGAASVGCTLEPGADGLEVVPRLPYESKPTALAAPQAWNGEPIVVDIERGNIEVIGDPDAEELTIVGDAITWAQRADDAGEIARAILATARVGRDANGAVHVTCGLVDGDFKSALPEATQCNIRVVVPAPAGATHDVQAYARDGFVYLHRLTTSPTSRIMSTGIEVEAVQLRGNVEVHAGWLDVEVKPIPGGRVVVESTTDDWYDIPTLQQTPKREPRDGGARFGATVRLPQDFRSQRVELYSAGASVETFPFPDVVSGAPRGPVDASAAQLIAVRANQGNATLLALDPTLTGTRTTGLGTSVRGPWND